MCFTVAKVTCQKLWFVICDALRDLEASVQFKKREKHSFMGVFHAL